MRTTERFEKAVTKLYKAFHAGELNPNDCRACAVGNLCDNNPSWNVIINDHKSGVLNGVGRGMEERMETVLNSGYSPLEIVTIEKAFLGGTGWPDKDDSDKENQFKGLCAVIEYLCELDNIPNPMDYSKLFETDNDKPKYELSL